jgi:Zn-dependent protease with chaperone function
MWAATQLLTLAIPILILITGFGSWLRQRISRRTGGRWFWTVTLFAVAYLVISAAIALPFDYYRDYVTLRGISHQTLSQWASGEAVPLFVKIVAAALFVWIPFALMARSPRRWWLYATAVLVPLVFVVLVIMPVWVDPLTTSYQPLKDKALYGEIENLAARCGVHNIPLLVGGNDTTVVGLGLTNRIVLEVNLDKHETAQQIRFTIGHELKHYVEGDNYKALAIIGVLLLTGLWLTDRLGTVAIARYRRRFGFSQLADPASLPLIVLILTLFWLCVLPFFNLFARHIEHEADRFGLELTHENRPMGEMFATFIVRDHEASDWSTFFLIFRANHPSNAERIRFANTYRPWAQGKPLIYGDVCRP